MTTEKINLLDFDRKGMRQFFAEELGEKAFRADQVMKWIYHFGVDDFEKNDKHQQEAARKAFTQV